MSEIDDISPEDQELLTSQVSQPLNLLFRDENVANEDLLFDDDDYQKWIEENDEDMQKQNKSAKIIQKFARRTPTRKLTRTINEEFKSLKNINDDDNLYFGSVRRANKVVRLDFHLSSPERMKKMGYDNPDLTPERNISNTRDASTSSRKSGRPKSSSYKVANPPRVSVGEMKNPY